MRARHALTEVFSSFLQFEADRVSGWIADPRLRRSMQTCLSQTDAQTSGRFTEERFWERYWHKHWQAQSNKLAEAHLSAYLQETCYWAAHKTLPRITSSQYKLSDCFQLAIAEVPRILKACDPAQSASLKTYSSVAFGNVIRDVLRQRQEIDFCNDWSLLLKLSRKRLQEALQHAGLDPDTIARYLLAWNCFETSYIRSKSMQTRSLKQPDAETWTAIATLYNTQRRSLDAPSTDCRPETLEKWLLFCSNQARRYLYPQVASLNMPKLGQDSGELQDDLSNADESLLANLIAAEESDTRRQQHAEIGAVLTAALANLDTQAQMLIQRYYQHGYTQQQIAQELGIPQYTVSRRLSKAREGLLLAITRWSEDTLHTTPTSSVIKHISHILDEWLQSHYQTLGDRDSEELSL
ncbi:sigma-70 family RNA polymerase sigma factor [Leptolyngbya sp. FACHB-36]|nr:sigma-70 family RNA polymerase sigma factor [Leptolyngbya sp. FACHB-36]